MEISSCHSMTTCDLTCTCDSSFLYDDKTAVKYFLWHRTLMRGELCKMFFYYRFI